MPRPTFLVVEPEPGFALSSRKLVMETAKYNVITAHSWREARELFGRFPAVEAVIVTNEVDEGVPCHEFVRHVKQQGPKLTVIVLTPNEHHCCEGADHIVRSHDPDSLLDLLRTLFGDPRPLDYRA